jgi:hypothetical protein
MRTDEDDAQLNYIIRNIHMHAFEKTYNTTIAEALEKIIYEEVDVAFLAIGQTVQGITPDQSVDHSAYISTRLMKKVMWATTSSIKYRFARRRKYEHYGLIPTFTFTNGGYREAKPIIEELKKMIAALTAQDAAIFMGKLAGIYIKTCPKKRVRDWAEKENINPISLFFMLTWDLEGGLLMFIDY